MNYGAIEKCCRFVFLLFRQRMVRQSIKCQKRLVYDRKGIAQESIKILSQNGQPYLSLDPYRTFISSLAFG